MDNDIFDKKIFLRNAVLASRGRNSNYGVTINPATDNPGHVDICLTVKHEEYETWDKRFHLEVPEEAWNEALDTLY